MKVSFLAALGLLIQVPGVDALGLGRTTTTLMAGSLLSVTREAHAAADMERALQKKAPRRKTRRRYFSSPCSTMAIIRIRVRWTLPSSSGF